ncbi:MAG TPA: DUF6519 domain-containing protein [Thermoanaerobaculia bacterium]|nr:DUF6519 domain-containing protein [Thermoanaerobaculia bacterium]
MKTQISRDGFRPDKRYSGVYQQQGRMITDRDWNELVDVLKSRLDEGMADAVGSGVPRRRGVALAKGSPSGIAITPGVVYAGGVAARIASAAGTVAPFAYDQQADYPSPPALPATGPYVLYADVWERPVLALEDDELRDPGLNGADTTTRTRTMAQVKWAAAPWNPEDPAQNPRRGNATLTAGIPAAASGDPLDGPSPAGGDYLFRLEVHDVWWSGGADQPGRVVLKWSRENGAEQYKALDAPSSFKAGPWIYEVYKQKHETILGYQFSLASTATPPARGSLVAGFPFLNPQNDADSFIRRWDGYCVLNRNGNTWTFSPNAPEDPRQTAPGAAAAVANGAFTVHLVDLEFSLDLQGKTFLPGDFWQVPVRRAIHGPGAAIVQAVQPAGIVHRYVTLANVSGSGDVTPATTTFPALTEITAGDVRYDGSGCTSGLYTAAHDNVKKALDRLWTLGAEHAAYAKPSNDSLYKDKTVTTVRDALNLLNDVRARQITYEGRAAFPDVQTAVDELFSRPSGEAGGFAVGTGGDFPDLLTAIQTLQAQGRRDLRLALLPGDYELNLLSPISNSGQPAHLTITGAGWASRLLVRKPAYFNDFASVTFQGIAMEFDPDALLQGTNCEFNLIDNRISGISKLLGVISPLGATRILLRDNIVEVAAGDPAAQPAAILTPLDSLDTMRTLFLTRSPRLFAIRARDLLAKLRALVVADRLRRVDTVQASVNAAGVPPATYNALIANLRQSSGPDDNAVLLLATLRLEALSQAGVGSFLTLLGNVPPTRLEGNQIFGWVRLYGSNDGDFATADYPTISAKIAAATFDPAAKNDLVVVNNRMSGLRVDANTIQTIRSSNPIAPLLQRIVATDNTFEAAGNQLAAVNVEMNSNLFLAVTAGWMVGEEILFLGNLARIDVGIDTFTKNVVLAGNSPHVKIRKV